MIGGRFCCAFVGGRIPVEMTAGGEAFPGYPADLAACWVVVHLLIEFYDFGRSGVFCLLVEVKESIICGAGLEVVVVKDVQARLGQIIRYVIRAGAPRSIVP